MTLLDPATTGGNSALTSSVKVFFYFLFTLRNIKEAVSFCYNILPSVKIRLERDHSVAKKRPFDVGDRRFILGLARGCGLMP